MNATRKLVTRIAAIAAAPLALVGTAQAAVPTEVTSAVGDLKADGLLIVAAVMGALIAIWGLKKLASKFGWA